MPRSDPEAAVPQQVDCQPDGHADGSDAVENLLNDAHQNIEGSVIQNPHNSHRNDNPQPAQNPQPPADPAPQLDPQDLILCDMDIIDIDECRGSPREASRFQDNLKYVRL